MNSYNVLDIGAAAERGARDLPRAAPAVHGEGAARVVEGDATWRAHPRPRYAAVMTSSPLIIV